MNLEQRGESICSAVVRFGNRNRFCEILAIPVLFIGWGEIAVPETAEDLYPSNSHTSALARLGAVVLVLLIALTVGIGLSVRALGNDQQNASGKNSSSSSSEWSSSSSSSSSSGKTSSGPATDQNQVPIPPKTASSGASVPTYASAQPTVQVAQPKNSSTVSGCDCTRRCTKDDYDTTCPVCKEKWENCSYQSKVTSYSDLITRFRELERWYDKIADISSAVTDDGSIESKSNRLKFLREFEALETLAEELADSKNENEDIYERLEQNSSYQKLLELYEVMKNYPSDSGSSSSSSSSNSTPPVTNAPVCKALPENGFYYVYANGFPVEISANPGGGTKISWSGSSHIYPASQEKDIVIFGGAEDQVLSGGTNITMKSGTVKAIFGGGNGKSVGGSTVIEVSGGKVLTDIYGGGNGKAASVKSTRISLMSAVVNGNVFGGGMQGRVDGAVDIKIGGSSEIGSKSDPATGHVKSGSYQGTVVGSKTVSVQDGPVITGGINLSELTGGVVKISGTLTGIGGSIRLSSPVAVTNGTVVATASVKGSAKAVPFALPGYGLSLDGETVKVANLYIIKLEGGEVNEIVDGKENKLEGTDSVLTVQYGAQLPGGITIPAMRDHSFDGYFAKADGTGTRYYDKHGNRLYAKPWDQANGTTLYAKWVKAISTAIFNLEGGTMDGKTKVEPVVKAAGAVIAIPDPQKTGFLFSKWDTNGTGGTLAGKNFRFGPESGEIMLTAQWVENTHDNLETAVQDDTELVAVSGLAEIFSDEDKAADKAQITFSAAEGSETSEGGEKIQKMAEGAALQWFDFSVEKTIYDGSNETVTALEELPACVTITVDLTDSLKGMAGYAVYRYHNGSAEQLAADSTGEDSDEYFTICRGTGKDGADQLVLHARKFSTYAIAGAKTSMMTRQTGFFRLDAASTDNIPELGGGKDVQAQVVERSDSVYKLDLLWGAMTFDYSADGRVWDPETHSYQPGGNPGWTAESFLNGNNRITAANHSNGDVLVRFDVTQNFLSGVTMSMKQTNSDGGAAAQEIPLGKVPSVGALAPEIFAYLRLSGEPDDLSNLGTGSYARAAVVTVTVAAAGGDITPE